MFHRPNHRSSDHARTLALFGTLLTLPLASGCVSNKKYEALEADLAKTRADLTSAGQRNQDLQTALEETETEVVALATKIADLDEQLAIAEARASDAESELAGLIKDKSQLDASIEQMQTALAELQRQQRQAEARAAEYRAVLARFQSLIDAGKLKAKIVDGRMILELQTDILFPSGSAKLSDGGRATIEEVAKLLAGIPEREFQIEGHTDNVPIKTKQYPSNWELAADRAINVVKAMVEAGMPPARVSAAAFADTRPTASNSTDAGRAQNRRIEIVIVPDLSALPGAEQLEKMSSGDNKS